VIETLRIIKLLSRSDATSATLQEKLQLNVQTLRRRIEDARSFGAEIESVKRENIFFYRLTNWNEIEEYTNILLKVFEKNSLVKK
jgi:hypothetical protein